jgi:hypothetical protein
MDKIIDTINMYCTICDEVHDVNLMERVLRAVVDEKKIEYTERYFICDSFSEDNEFMNGKMLNENLKNLRTAFAEAGVDIPTDLAQRESARHNCSIEVPYEIGSPVWVIEKDCDSCAFFYDPPFTDFCDCRREPCGELFDTDFDKECKYVIKEKKFDFGMIDYFDRTVFSAPEKAIEMAKKKGISYTEKTDTKK